jgi:hypothetical protein
MMTVAAIASSNEYDKSLQVQQLVCFRCLDGEIFEDRSLYFDSMMDTHELGRIV